MKAVPASVDTSAAENMDSVGSIELSVQFGNGKRQRRPCVKDEISKFIIPGDPSPTETMVQKKGTSILTKRSVSDGLPPKFLFFLCCTSLIAELLRPIVTVLTILYLFTSCSPRDFCRRDGVFFKISRYESLDVEDLTDSPELGIKIFIREKVWLQSRRIVDNAGRPITKVMAELALSQIQLGTKQEGKAKGKSDTAVINLT